MTDQPEATPAHLPSGTTTPTRRLATALGLLLVLVATLVAYTPAFQADFTNWDDPAYVTRNPLIRELSSENIRRMFTEVYWAAYYPLTLLSYAIEHRLVGLSPWLYHADNVLLHLGTTALLFWWVLLLEGLSEIPAQQEIRGVQLVAYTPSRKTAAVTLSSADARTRLVLLKDRVDGASIREIGPGAGRSL